MLILGIDQRQHVGQRRPGADRQQQLVRLVGNDRIKRRHVEHGIGREHMADGALTAMTENFEGLLVGERSLHHLLDVSRIAYFENIHQSPA